MLMMFWCTTGTAAGVDPAVPSAPNVVDVNAPPPEPLYAAPTALDRSGRILAAVRVNGRGPYRFIIDTGANRSAVSPRLVTDLGLLPSAAGVLQTHGVTGEAALPAVDVDQIRAGDLVYDPGPLPVLAGLVLGDTDGILGTEGLAGARVDVDFATDSVSITRSHGKRAANGYFVVPARSYRGLLLVAGKAGRIPVHAIIDTGAERTLGNAPLRDALISKVGREGKSRSRVVGATDAGYDGMSFRVPALRIGAASLYNMPVTFGDMHVFEVWGLANEPAVLIGMDMIGQLRRFVVDYRRWEIHLMPKGPRQSTVKKCGPTECRSRIPEPDST
jgi:predicted aspartyl protease